MNKRENVSICIDDLFAASKAGHPAITTAANGKKYANLTLWFNDKVDNYGNDVSVQLYDKETQEATYIGNGKSAALWAQKNRQAPQTAPQQAQTPSNEDDLPY